MSKFMSEVVAAAAETDHGLWSGSAGDLRETKWADVHRRAVLMAGKLQTLGIDHGTRVAVLAVDPTAVASLIQAVLLRGATVTMLQQPTPQADLAGWQAGCLQVLSMLDVRHLVIGDPFLDTEPMFSSHGVTVLRLDGDWGSRTPGDFVECAEDDVALFQLTSGSTGLPKAVGISHGNLYANAIAMQKAAAGRIDRDVMVSWLPLSHDMGLIGFLVSPMFFGVKTVCVSPLEFLHSPMNWLRLISDHRGTITAAPNFAYLIAQRRLARVESGRYDLSSLRFALCGAEPIDPTTMRAFAREAQRFGFDDAAIVAAYGMAEATLAVSFATVGQGLRVDSVDGETLASQNRAHPVDPAAGSGREVTLLGQPLHGMEIRVAGADGAPLTPRHVGELVIRGDAVTSRYVTSDGEVSAVDASGWLNTGDLGYVTEDGQVAVCGRLKNVIIVSGRNIYPSDVEKAAETVEGVRRGGVVAFGRTSSNKREELCVVVEAGGSSDAREIQRGVARSVFGSTGISPTVFVHPRGTIPKTASGKLKHLEAKRIFATAEA
jgi:fatty-acyl-CoA synthase